MDYRVNSTHNMSESADDIYCSACGLAASWPVDWQPHACGLTASRQTLCIPLCDVEEESNSISSVAWNGRGSQLAVGTHNGMTQIWDTARLKMVREMDGHSARVSSAGWNDGNILSTGSRDRSILVRDIRAPEPYYSKLLGHKQEVCGMKWSFDGQQLATGGNDNNLYIWGNHSNAPLARFPDHQAAVKALAWSPHQHGVLASGGGTADRCIRFWNTQTLSPLKFYDTGSQVCNLVWSKTVNELVSTHGYSLNQIILCHRPEARGHKPESTATGHRPHTGCEARGRAVYVKSTYVIRVVSVINGVHSIVNVVCMCVCVYVRCVSQKLWYGNMIKITLPLEIITKVKIK